MHVFGCLCYPWLRPYCPPKLSPRSQKCDLWFTVSFTKGIFTLIYHHQSFSPYAMLFFMIRSFLFETKMIWHPMLRILLLLLFSYLICSQPHQLWHPPTLPFLSKIPLPRVLHLHNLNLQPHLHQIKHQLTHPSPHLIHQLPIPTHRPNQLTNI